MGFQLHAGDEISQGNVFVFLQDLSGWTSTFYLYFFATERTSGQFIIFSTTACQVRFKEILDYKLCLHDGDLNIEGCTVQP